MSTDLEDFCIFIQNMHSPAKKICIFYFRLEKTLSLWYDIIGFVCRGKIATAFCQIFVFFLAHFPFSNDKKRHKWNLLFTFYSIFPFFVNTYDTTLPQEGKNNVLLFKRRISI